MVLSNRPKALFTFAPLACRSEPKGEEIRHYSNAERLTRTWIIEDTGDNGWTVWEHDGFRTYEGTQYETEAEARSEVEWRIAELEVG